MVNKQEKREIEKDEKKGKIIFPRGWLLHSDGCHYWTPSATRTRIPWREVKVANEKALHKVEKDSHSTKGVHSALLDEIHEIIDEGLTDDDRKNPFYGPKSKKKVPEE